MQLIRQAVQKQMVLSDVAELRDSAKGVVGFKLCFGGHPLYCCASGHALEESLAFPARLAGVTEWSMIRHLPWTRALGLPLRSARAFQNLKNEWVALQLHFGSDVDSGITLQLVAGDVVVLLEIFDEEEAPAPTRAGGP